MVDNVNEFGCDPKMFSDVRNCAAHIRTEQGRHRTFLSEQRMCEPSAKQERTDAYMAKPDPRTSTEEVQRQPERDRRRESERDRKVRRESTNETERARENIRSSRPSTTYCRKSSETETRKQHAKRIAPENRTEKTAPIYLQQKTNRCTERR